MIQMIAIHPCAPTDGLNSRRAFMIMEEIESIKMMFNFLSKI